MMKRIRNKNTDIFYYRHVISVRTKERQGHLADRREKRNRSIVYIAQISVTPFWGQKI